MFKKILKDIKLGLGLTIKTPTLGPDMVTILNYPLVRVYRVIGGFSLVLFIGQSKITFLPFEFFIFIMPLAFSFVLFQFYIAYYKFIHIRRLFKEKKLEIRNSPLNRLATFIYQTGLSLKGSCEYAITITTILGFSIGLDTFFTNSPSTPIDMLTDINSSTQNKSGLLLLISNLTNKIPILVKIIFVFLLLITTVLKLLGLGYLIPFILHFNLYFKLYAILGGLLGILNELFTLYSLHKFISNPDLKIPEILPDFLIKWLNGFKILSTSKESIKDIKKFSYLHAGFYLILIIIIILTF